MPLTPRSLHPGSLVISYSRVAALVSGYSAPLRVLETLAPAPPGTATRVFCIGREWYRFPSSFFLPSPSDELRFVDSGDFKGASFLAVPARLCDFHAEGKPVARHAADALPAGEGRCGVHAAGTELTQPGCGRTVDTVNSPAHGCGGAALG